MTRALLDVNVLLALLDQNHVHHGRARNWLTQSPDPAWASCALSQNGYLRIASSPMYPNNDTVAGVVARLENACATEHHEFWSCDVSLLGPAVIDRPRLLGPKQITDVYLLALAVAHDGRLVTFDRTVPIGAVVGATDAHLVVL